MFKLISSKLSSAVKTITGNAVISEKNIEDALKTVRMSLLEADVNYKVVKAFTENVKNKALGEDVLGSLSPGQQFVKILHSELVSFLGEKEAPLNLSKKPCLIMLTGLQGSGKTTTAGKLARYLIREKGLKKILLVAADTYRPAAREQLEKLSKEAGADFFTLPENNAVKICSSAVSLLADKYYDAVVFDTAGRLHFDENMANELKKIKLLADFSEILLVADAMLGQESVNIASGFNKTVGLTGIILTKTDGDARGGAALSMKHEVNVPIKFTGTGEKQERLDRFYPDRMASRILGMGDIVSLAEKTGKLVTEEQAKKTAEKLKKASFTLSDFLEQMQAMKNMGPLDELMKMIPGAEQAGMGNLKLNENDLKHTEAIILSMTQKERNNPDIIEMSRRKRIAAGSGTTPERVNKLLKQFSQMKKMMKKAGRSRFGKNPFGGMPGF
mgnify:CR=1 FL=1